MTSINNTITTNIVALAEQGARQSVIKAELQATGHEYQFVRLVGTARRAVITDVPMEIDTYRTVNRGVLQIFSVSTAKVGDIVDGHTVVYNRVVSGDAHMAGYVTYIAIKL
jgi:expansin (peptidoglycan-binding protein)